MPVTDGSPRGSRPGGRSARTRAAVFNVTMSLLEQGNISDLSVQKIAAEAGIAESTIYRRWGSLTGLLTDVISDFSFTENPIPNTGNLKEDLTQLLRNVVSLIQRPTVRRIFYVAMSLENGDQELTQVRSDFWHIRFNAGTEIVRRAIKRQEIAPLDDPQLVIEALVGPAYLRTFLLGDPITETVIEKSTQAALALTTTPPNEAN